MPKSEMFTMEFQRPEDATKVLFLGGKYNQQEQLWSGGSDGKASACNAGHPGSIPGLGRSPGEGNGNPLQHSCLENPMEGGT